MSADARDLAPSNLHHTTTRAKKNINGDEEK
jgi:hypothetical protein